MTSQGELKEQMKKEEVVMFAANGDEVDALDPKEVYRILVEARKEFPWPIHDYTVDDWVTKWFGDNEE